MGLNKAQLFRKFYGRELVIEFYKLNEDLKEVYVSDPEEEELERHKKRLK